MENIPEASLVTKADDRLVRYLNKIVVVCVKCLAVLITLVIMWGVCDVAVHLFNQASSLTFGVFNIENLLVTMGNFLAVLIAIEIFLNIIFYLKKDALHVHMVLATALTAIARKIIVVDFSITPTTYIYAAAAAILAIGAAFWLVKKAQDNDA